ncbi:MAG: DUF4013 domain-containing protein [Methanobacterium sp. ERen5]|nr:MAG: DUF4013 domain-containing protein [Methanobacterium sp. ERen5]
MKVRVIIKDSLKYPLSDYKKFLILGLIFIIIYILNFSAHHEKNVYLLVLLIGIAFVVGFFVNGYIFRIINSTFDGKDELPEFNNWQDMGVDGVKVYLAYIVYLIPVLLIIIDFILLFGGKTLNFGYNVFDFIPEPSSVLWQGINSFINSVFTIEIASRPEHTYQPLFGILCPIGLLYAIIITPIALMAIANMVLDEGDLKSAYKIHEIFEEISVIGWGNLIKWYILTGIIYIIIMSIISFIFLLQPINPIIIKILSILLIGPYFSMFLARSIALFYIPEY